MNLFLTIFFIALAALGSRALASELCMAELNKLVKEWKSIAVPGTPPADSSHPGAQEHEHNAREVWYMREQIRLGLRLCDENKEHEAMLRMDIVRAWLKLPEVQHPPDHRYSLEEETH